MIPTSASTRGPSARTMVPTVRPALTFPGVVRPSAPKKTDYEPWSVPSYPEDGRTGWLGSIRETSVKAKMDSAAGSSLQMSVTLRCQGCALVNVPEGETGGTLLA